MKIIDGLTIPESEQDIIDIIKDAVATNKTVRVRGSAHSVPKSIFTKDYDGKTTLPEQVNLYLSELNKVTLEVGENGEDSYVRAQAGVHLGYDPRDPSGKATIENSLFYKLNEAGFALPDSGGIIHQTVGGFLATGSSGGSIRFSMADCIEEFTFIDGLGNRHVVDRQKDADTFNALAVSMGLLGIVTEVKFKLVRNYTVRGTEEVYSYETVPIDVFGEGNGKPTLFEFFEKADHARLYWYPHQGVREFTIWQAYVDEQPPKPDWEKKRKSYEEFPAIFKSFLGMPLRVLEIPAEYVARLLFRVTSPLNFPKPSGGLKLWWYNRLASFYPFALRKFINGEMKEPQKFYDIWYKGLPMDNDVNYDILPVQFTELWFNRERATEALRVLNAYYEEHAFEATGTEPVELYATGHSPFWLSPAYGETRSDDVIKIDAFWFGDDPDYPEKHFYPQIWNLLRPHGYRPHWGKIQAIEPEYLKQLFPKWDAWMAKREQYDPHQIFVTQYWRERMDIPAKE